MKVNILRINAVNTQPCGTSWVLPVKLFSTEGLAVNFIEEEYPNAIDITERLKEKFPWKDDIERTFFCEIPKYDSDGQWDYSTEYTFVITEAEVIGSTLIV